MEALLADNDAIGEERQVAAVPLHSTGAGYGRWLCLLFFLIAVVGLRIVCLGSDAYSRLSWSSALLTDEGFYCHNARNVVLLGSAQPDPRDTFRNDLIMPVLHCCQIGVFHLFGVGAIQTRSISVVTGLLTLLVFFCAMRRAFGSVPAWIGVVLLGFDHANLLYSRLALMDTPAALPMTAVFYCLIRAFETPVDFHENPEAKRSKTSAKHGWLVACGVLLAVAYGVRGLSGLLVVAVLGTLLWQAWDVRHLSQSRSEISCITSVQAFAIGLGLTVAGLVYLLAWYLPHHAELARVNDYYIHHQLIPSSLRQLGINLLRGFFGDDRGFSPYLFRHQPIQFALVLIWLTFSFRKSSLLQTTDLRKRTAETNGRLLERFLTLWIVIYGAFFAVISYAPDRYYVLVYPAMMAVSALALCKLPAIGRALLIHNRRRTLLMMFFTYHLCVTVWHHKSVIDDILLAALVALSALISLRLPAMLQRQRSEAAGQRTLTRMSALSRLPAILLACWFAFNFYWLGDWLLHLTYRQRDADTWLAANLPANSVLIGDVAPGLCLNNRLRAVNVISGLCNDDRIIEKYADAPRYIVILDDVSPPPAATKWKEFWWQKHYPLLVEPKHRIAIFPRIVHLPVGVYAVEKQTYAEK